MDPNFYHKPRKRFGQNFLRDPFIIQKILEVLHIQPEDHFAEIGPGLGALTKPLLSMVDDLDVIELDRDLAKQLKEEFHFYKQLTVYQKDALTFNFQEIFKNNRKLRIIGNLPYNISTPLLFHLLHFSPILQDMHLMLQKEVVDRITAKPGSKAYGRLSVMVQYHSETHCLFTVPPEAFKPIPKVNSAVIRLIPYLNPPFITHNISTFQKIVTTAFTQRRKTLKNSLKDYLNSKDFEILSLNATTRPEELSVESFVKISNYVTEKKL